MNDPTETAALAPTLKITARLVKWDGEPPADAEPIGHPQCVEVLDLEDGEVRTVYRRPE